MTMEASTPFWMQLFAEIEEFSNQTLCVVLFFEMDMMMLKLLRLVAHMIPQSFICVDSNVLSCCV